MPGICSEIIWDMEEMQHDWPWANNSDHGLILGDGYTGAHYTILLLCTFEMFLNTFKRNRSLQMAKNGLTFCLSPSFNAQTTTGGMCVWRAQFRKSPGEKPVH